MDKDLLRRDQIWFANKNQYGESELYSLSEFNSDTVRNTSAYDKKYLNNDFGAAETMEMREEAMSLLYGEKAQGRSQRLEEYLAPPKAFASDLGTDDACPSIALPRFAKILPSLPKTIP